MLQGKRDNFWGKWGTCLRPPRAPRACRGGGKAKGARGARGESAVPLQHAHRAGRCTRVLAEGRGDTAQRVSCSPTSSLD